MTGAGAYGFRLEIDGGDPADRLDLVEYGDDVPVVRVRAALASAIRDEERVGEDHLVLGWRSGGRFDVRRRPPRIDLVLPEPQRGGALVHPSLTVPMAVLARWRGDVTLHAGAFAAGAAWAVLGDRRAGKSTTLAALARAGRAVVADDLLVVDRAHVWAGPHCVDLRPDAARQIPDARFVADVGGRPRWRLSSPPAPARMPLGGFFVLEWTTGDAVEVKPISASSLLPLLYGLEYVSVLGPPPAERVLSLLDLPSWRVRRPRSWAAEPEVVGQMLAVTGWSTDHVDETQPAE